MPRWALGLVSALGRGYIRLVGLTTRYEREGEQHPVSAAAESGPLVWVMWHNRLLGPVIPHRKRGVGVVISRSRDGELISRVVGGLGYVPLRGSTSRGGAGVLRAVLRHLRRGADVAFTPDGPRGPRYTVQPGVAYAASKTGRPVIPVGVGMSRKVVFGSWDRFQLPLPFGRVRLVYGEPLRFCPADDTPEAAETIRAALDEVNQRADRALGVRSP